MTTHYDDRPPCAVCRKRPAQGIVAGKDDGKTIHIAVCGECFIEQRHDEVRLWRRSLALVVGGWPR